MFIYVYRLVQTCLFLSVCYISLTHPPTGWRHGHGLQPTARAMAKMLSTLLDHPPLFIHISTFYNNIIKKKSKSCIQETLTLSTNLESSTDTINIKKSHVMCQVSHILCHVSYVTCHLSPVTNII